jgi:hypothetical protein
MYEVEEFILNFEGKQRDLLQFLYELLMEQPGMSCKISYRVPFFLRKQQICYLNPRKDGSVELSFIRGHQLSNEQGILEFRSRKFITGITLESIENIPLEGLHEVIQEAILLDDIPYTPPYAFKKKKS